MATALVLTWAAAALANGARPAADPLHGEPHIGWETGEAGPPQRRSATREVATAQDRYAQARVADVLPQRVVVPPSAPIFLTPTPPIFGDAAAPTRAPGGRGAATPGSELLDNKAASPSGDDPAAMVHSAQRAAWTILLLSCIAVVVTLLLGLAVLMHTWRRTAGALRVLERAVTDGFKRHRAAEDLPPGFQRLASTIEAREAAWVEALGQQRRLVQEVNHRVAGTLQMVVSLLRLEPESVPARQRNAHDLVNLLREAEHRVSTIATVHQTIRSVGTEETGDAGQLLWSIADRLIAAFGHAGRVALKIDVQPMPLTTDETITVSLIVNEWITASLVRSDPAVTSGTIGIAVHASGRHRQLRLSRDFDTPRPSSSDNLSAEMLNGLIDQLGGRRASNPRDGRCLAFEFPTR